MRLFVGIDLPSSVTASISDLIRRLKPAAAIRWSPAENLHITTKFIGEWDRARLEELKRALAAVPCPAPFVIEVRGLGWFPNPHHPRVFWAAIHAGGALAELARATDETVAALGVPRETRPYSPHLTLARVNEGVSLVALRQAVAALESADFGSFRVSEYHLYRSEPGLGGSVYTRLATFPLLSAVH
jgi:2'-5' RNA ligase